MTTLSDALQALGLAFEDELTYFANVQNQQAPRIADLTSSVSNLVLRADGQASRIAQLESDLSAALARIAALESGTGTEEPPPPPPPPPPSKVLVQRTGPVASTHDGQVIEGLDIIAEVGNALTVTHANVTVKDCRIKHKEGHGIHCTGHSPRIQNVEVINVGSPTGQVSENSENRRNINLDGAGGAVIDTVTLREGSSGIYLHLSPNATIRNVKGFNFKGPMPRGQFVQFDKSPNGYLEKFYAYNDPANSWVEDIVSVAASTGVTIKDGLLIGCNSPTGWGFMFEMNSTGGRVSDVDCKWMGCGSFCSYSSDVIFTNCRAFMNVGTDQGRGMPSSGALNFGAVAPGVGFVNCKIVNPGKDNRLWDASNAKPADIVRDDTLVMKGDPTSIAHFWN